MRLSIVALAMGAWAGIVAPAPTAGQESNVVLGTVTESVVSSSDPTQRYALFVPSTYRGDSVWPVVFVMDPRGRALVPLERLREPAERLGYVLISSYNTASDGPPGPNDIAVEAMIADAQQLFSVDDRRLYFVGFSGTARAAWVFGTQLAQHTAGVIGFGAGLPSASYLFTLSITGEPAFAFFGGAGELDFNFEEVLQLDWALDSHGFAHFVSFYPGPHAWPPAAVFAEALEWLDVQAVRSEFRSADPALLDVLFTKRFDRAQALEAAGDVRAAGLGYRSIAADFDGLVSVDEPRSRAERLTRSREFRKIDEALRKAIEEREQYDVRFTEFLVGVRESNQAPDVSHAVSTLKIEEIRRRAAREGDQVDAKSAQRLLERVFVQTSFYEPRHYIEQGAFEFAVAMYQLADVIKPGTPRVCLGLGRAYAQMSQLDLALQALECAVSSQALGRSQLESDSLLAPLRGEARFTALLERLP